MKKITKILSILCALALIVSCVSVGFVVSAEPVAVWSSSDTAGGYPGNNLFANATIVFTGVANETNIDIKRYKEEQLAMSTNGENGDNFTPGVSSVLNSDNNSSTTVKQTDAYLQWTWDLNGSVSQPEKFIYTAHNITSVAGQYISVHYEIFASDTLYDLYDANNSIYLHSAEQGAGVQHVIDISALDLPKVKFFGARFYHRPYDGTAMHAAELGLYGGTYTASKAVYTESMTHSDTYSTDNHITSNGTVTYVVNGSTAGTGTIPGHYYNGKADGAYHEYGFSKANNNPFQDDTYIQFEYNFKYAVDKPEKFILAAGTGWDNMMSQRYTVFASSDKANLYNDESIVYEYISPYGGDGNNVNPQPMEQEIDISGLELKNVKYFAVRFYHRPYDTSYTEGGRMIFISEIGLYGGESKNPLSVKNALSGDYSDLGANALANSVMTYGGKMDDGTDYGSKVPDFALLTDGNSAKENHAQTKTWAGLGSDGNITQKNEYLEIKFALTSTVYNPTKVLAAFRAGSSSQHFEIFASEKEAELYNSSVYEYSSGSQDPAEIYVNIEGSVAAVNYVAFRFYELPSAAYLLLYELGLYGGKSAFSVESELTSDAYGSYAAYGENILSTGDITFSLTDAGNPDQTWKSDSLNPTLSTSKQKVGLHDNTSGSVDHIQPGDAIGSVGNTTQTDEFIEIKYDLKNNYSDLGKFMLVARNAGEMPIHYAIFASNSEADLFAAPVFEFASANVNGHYEHHVDLSLFDLSETRYFAIRFYGLYSGSATYLLLHEIALYTVPEEVEVDIQLAASVYNSTAPGSGDANDIQYKLDLSTAVKADVVEAGLISGFKVNIDADNAFAGDYVEYLKTSANGAAISKTTIPEELFSSKEVYFHHTNSGTHNGKDYSAYRICTIAYVVVDEGENGLVTYWSNLIDKSSMQVSRNQAKAYKEAGYNVAGYENYAFATDGNIDIAIVRAYVEAAYELQLFNEVSKINIVKDSVLNSNIRPQGRAYVLKSSLGIANPAAGFEFNAYCEGDVSITINCNGDDSLDDRGPRFVVVVDGVTTYDVAASALSGDIDLTLATGLARGNHSFAVYRMTPSTCDAKYINLKGRLIAPPKANDLKIAFVGDSITVGHYSVLNVSLTNGKQITDWDGSKIASTKVVVYNESGSEVGTYDFDNVQFSGGNLYVENTAKGIDLTYSLSSYSYQIKMYDANGAFVGEFAKNTRFGTAYSNSYDTYAVKTAKALGADWDILGISGNTIENVVNSNYIFTTYKHGAAAYDPDADIYVINMATNSMYSGSNASNYGNAMEKAVKQIQKANPDAKIVFVYGSMRNDEITKYYDSTWTSGTYSITEHHQNIRNKATSLNTTYGNVYSFGFSRAMREGGAAHPSIADQGVMAQELAAFINTIK